MTWKEDADGVLTWHPRLMFYEKEHELFSEAYGKKLSNDKLDLVFRKLRRHYKLNITIRYNKYQNGAFRYSKLTNRMWIEVPKETSFGLLCHEIAHAIDKVKRGKSKHDKRFMKVIKRVISYCKKKNWWESNPPSRTICNASSDKAS